MGAVTGGFRSILKIGYAAIAFIVGAFLLLLLLGMLIQLWNAMDALAQSTGDHGFRWWAVRVLLGVLAAGILSFAWGLISNAAVALLNFPAYGIGWLLSFVWRGGVSWRVRDVALAMVEFGKTFSALFGGLAFYWYVILAPFLSWVPLWSLRIGVLFLVLIWTPGVALLGFATRSIKEEVEGATTA